MRLDDKSKKKLSAILLASILATVLLTQLPSEVFANHDGAKFATIAANVGLGWDNPSGAVLPVIDPSNNTDCASTTSANRQIDLTNFGFSIPLGDTIFGIKVEPDFARTNGAPASAQLLKALAPVGDSKSFMRPGSADDCASSNFVSLPDTATNDLWGTTWTPAEINAAGFGVRIDSGGGAGERFLDSVRITVFHGVCTTDAITMIDCLIQDVQSLVPSTLNAGQANSLTAKLDVVKSKLSMGQEKPALNVLQAFINEVKALGCDLADPECTLKILSDAQVANLIGGTGGTSDHDASDIIDELDDDPIIMTFNPSTGVLSGTVQLTAGETEMPVLVANSLEPANPSTDVNKLSTIEFTTDPSKVGTGTFDLQIIVTKQVLSAPQPPGTVLFSFDVNPTIDLSSEGFFTSSGLPVVTFEVTKDFSPANVQILFFDGSQWVLLGSPTLVEETTDSFLMQGVLPHFSKFVVTGGGGVGGGGSGGGGGPAYVIIDTVQPSIVTHYYKPETPVAGQDLTILARIIDDVKVSDVNILYFIKTAPEHKFYQISMDKISTEWWSGTIQGTDVGAEGLSYMITATDPSGNTVVSPVVDLKIEEAKVKAKAEKVTPSTKRPTKTDLKPNNFIEVITTDGANTISDYSSIIVVKNKSDFTLENVRIMLSPQISKSFYLDRYSIKSIEPNGNVTVNVKLLGKPNANAYGRVTAYDGEIIVMAPNHNPVTLPVKINSFDYMHQQAYMDKVALLAQQRYNKLSLINTILKSGLVEKSDIEVTTRTGSREISAPSDEILIKNLSDRTLNNVRVMISKTSNAFLLDKYNVKQIEPNGEASIRMIPKIDTGKYMPRDYRGEVIIAPENGIPRAIPVYIPATPMHDSIDEFEVRVAGNEMTTALDRIHVKNTGDRAMDSVKIVLSSNLAKIFSLSESSFKTIEPGEEVIIEMKYAAKDLRAFMQDYDGEIKIVSEHHNMRTIPVKIQWNKVESDNFAIYARNGDLSMTNNVLKYLENHYQSVASAFGAVNQKSTIYMTGSLEEMQLLNYYGYSFYSYSNDAIFICSCDNPRDSALQEFIYRTMIMNFPTYYNMKKIENDGENWLVDGLAKYIVTKNNETSAAKYIDAFMQEPVEFQWYGSATDAQYGSAITFFRYLEKAYGEDAIYRSLYHLGSGMVSNHRCDTVENCAVLRGIYDASGLDINNKRFDIDFSTIVREWYFTTVVQGWH